MKIKVKHSVEKRLKLAASFVFWLASTKLQIRVPDSWLAKKSNIVRGSAVWDLAVVRMLGRRAESDEPRGAVSIV